MFFDSAFVIESVFVDSTSDVPDLRQHILIITNKVNIIGEQVERGIKNMCVDLFLDIKRN